MSSRGPKRCSAPKTASGMAKHKLLKATILSRPRAEAISLFAANTPIKKSAMPAEQVAATVGEVSKNVARMVGCIDFPTWLSAEQGGTRTMGRINDGTHDAWESNPTRDRVQSVPVHRPLGPACS